MKIYPTIAESLTLGGSKLAVDGVVVVGEHGTYPLTETGIMKHPHFEFFEQATKVFRDSGRSVPYFNDKELSWNWDWSKQMVDTSHQMGFPLQGGSSLAMTWRIPSVELPLGATGARSRVCRLRWNGQLRLPRTGDQPVHGGAGVRAARRE